MTFIEATCPTCGTVECTVADFELAICDDHTPSSYYTFVCPGCNDRVQKHAEERVIELLIGEGVNPRKWVLPAELREEHHGAAFTVDDLLDFHLFLERPDWFGQLRQTSA